MAPNVKKTSPSSYYPVENFNFRKMNFTLSTQKPPLPFRSLPARPFPTANKPIPYIDKDAISRSAHSPPSLKFWGLRHHPKQEGRSWKETT